MQNFSQIVTEYRERTNYDSVSLLSSEINKYMTKVKKQLPKAVQDIIYQISKYEFSGEKLQQIKDASSKGLQVISNETGVSVDVLHDIQKQLNSLKNNIRLLPQFQTPEERAAIESGKIDATDLTIDLSTSTGRNNVAKMYTPIVYKIVNQYVGKSSLDRAALISAGMSGLAEAMNDFDPSKTDKPFKSYAAYRIQQAILNDINEYSHSLSGTNWYASQKYADRLDAVSLDSLSKDDDEFSLDHIASLGVSDDHRWIDLTKDEQEYWKTLYKIIDSKFSTRDCNIFYRYFGLGEFWGKKEKSKDIAKSYGMSEGNIRNSVINKILKFLRDDPKCKNILSPLLAIYSESIMKDLVYLDNKQAIYDALISDDTFILLEELNRWNNKDVFKRSIINALNGLSVDDALYITQCIERGFEYIDDTYKKHKNIIIGFLKFLYPTESFNKLSDVAIIEYITDISNIAKDYKIKL